MLVSVASVPSLLMAPARIPLEPVDSLVITTLVENTYDIFMPDQGPAHRQGPDPNGPRLEAATMVDRQAPDQLIAEHGFSLLLTVTIGQGVHRFLFDCGVRPTGMVENMRRLSLDPTEIEAVICSHGHFDHTTGLDALIQRLGRRNLPILLHPDFWNRRRMTLPGRPPHELPNTLRRPPDAAGVTIAATRRARGCAPPPLAPPVPALARSGTTVTVPCCRPVGMAYREPNSAMTCSGWASVATSKSAGGRPSNRSRIPPPTRCA